MEWISVDKELPNDCGLYLVCRKNSKDKRIDLLVFDGNNWLVDGKFPLHGVTHWVKELPLPK